MHPNPASKRIQVVWLPWEMQQSCTPRVSSAPHHKGTTRNSKPAAAVAVAVMQGKVQGLQQQVSALQEDVKSKQQESEAFANGTWFINTQLTLHRWCRTYSRTRASNSPGMMRQPRELVACCSK
jgi:hypothetical protein